MRNKKNMQGLFSLSFLLILAIFASCSSGSSTPAPVTATTGLFVSVATSTAGGNYTPRNVVAIWVENSAGTFVKTLTVYAQAREYDLTHWSASSGGNKVDAITGATQNSFGTIKANWNGTDTSGKVVADGTYKVCMELTDKSSTGNFSSFQFTKGTATATLTPANVQSFSSISLKWIPLL
jgi:hypothetical protein